MYSEEEINIVSIPIFPIVVPQWGKRENNLPQLQSAITEIKGTIPLACNV